MVPEILTEGALAALLPPWCTWAVRGEDFDPVPWVRPEEMALLSPRAVEKRRREFTLGRACARLALRQARCAVESPILRGARGEPLWPPGWVGSITHVSGVAAAVVAPAHLAEGIGIDLESLKRDLDQGMLSMICLDDERAWVERGDWRVRAKMIFSAKESIFKALFPKEPVFIDFKDARVRWSDEGRTFEGELFPGRLGPLHLGSTVSGRWTLAGGLVATALVVPAAG